MTYYTHIFRTPVGDLYTAVNERGAVVRLLFAKEGRMAALESGLEGTIVRDAARCRHVVDQIEEYFGGERRAFDLDCCQRRFVEVQGVETRGRGIDAGHVDGAERVSAERVACVRYRLSQLFQ